MADLDMADAEALRGFGRAGDDGLGRISREMLLALDAGENTHIAGELTALARALAATQSGAASAPDAASARLTLWQRLRRRPAPRAGRQAAEAWRQVGRLAEDLLRRHRDLMARLRRLDMLYEQGLDHYDALALDLAAGQECLRLARLELAMPRRADPATLAVPPPCCDVLERRLEEMAVTRHRVAQALPLVRLAQEEDKRLLGHLSDLLSRALPDCARAAGTTPPGPQEVARHDHCLTTLLQGQALAEQGQVRQGDGARRPASDGTGAGRPVRRQPSAETLTPSRPAPPDTFTDRRNPAQTGADGTPPEGAVLSTKAVLSYGEACKSYSGGGRTVMTDKAESPAGGLSRSADPRSSGRRRGAERWSSRIRPLALGLTLPVLLSGCADMADLFGPKGPPQESLRPFRAPKPPHGPRSPRSKAACWRPITPRPRPGTWPAGLLRQDGGGDAEAAHDRDDLVRNFERIAFYSEHRPGAGLAAGDGMPGQLLRWQQPVRMRVTFGTSVDEATRDDDRAVLRGYARRLAHATGHSIGLGTGPGGNFHVLVMGEDDREEAIAELRSLVPNLSASTRNTLRTLPRDIPCLVMGFAAAGNLRPMTWPSPWCGPSCRS